MNLLHPKHLMALSTIFVSSILFAGLPEPLPLTLPAGTPDVAKRSQGQIERINFDPSFEYPELLLSAPVGANYTISFWVWLDDLPVLAEKDFSSVAPVTLVDFASADRPSSWQQLVIRIMGGKFQVTASHEQKWRMLPGFGGTATPGLWHHLVYARSAEGGVFYVNGDVVMRTPVGAPVQDDLQSLVLGRFYSGRRLSGVMFEPRLYAETLSHDDVVELRRNPPASIR